MNNIMIGLKRFFKNKNTVTIVGVLLGVAILFWGYNKQISDATQYISVPVAKETIQPRTEITSAMVTTIQVARSAIATNVYRTSVSIIGKYSNYNTVIPKGSMFYNTVLVKKEDLPDSSFVEVADGEIPYNFAVTMSSTYGNAIFPSNMIDIYMKAETDSGKIMIGKLIENIEVLAVKDSSGKNVFENSEISRTPSFLIFGVEQPIHILLRKASYMSKYGVILFPVPHGGTAVVGDQETLVSSLTLQQYIEGKTATVDDFINVTDTE